MEEKIALSVLVLAYNSGKTLARALRSLLEEQTFVLPYEVILLLDPSQDDSAEIAESFRVRHPNLTIFAPEERMGIGKSRILGIEKARGEYFYFVDADDYLTKDALSLLYQTAKETGSDCVNCSFYYVKNAKPHLFPWAKNATLTGGRILKDYFGDSYIRGFCWSKIYRASIAKNRPLLVLGAPLDMQFEDVALNCALLSYCRKVTSLKKPLYYYVKDNTGSAMSKPRTNRAFRHLVVFALERYFLQEQKNVLGLKAFKDRLFRTWLSLRYDLFLDKKNGAAKEEFLKVKKGWKTIKNMKTPLCKNGSFFEKDIDNALYFRKDE